MSSLEEFFADLFGENTKVVLGDTGIEVGFNEFLDMATGGAFDDGPPAPRRDSQEYRETITYVAGLDRLEVVISSLKGLLEDYGWRGPVDVMAEWIAQIERSPMTRDGRFRDMTGVVDLATIIVMDADDEQRLRIAADKREKYTAEEGLPPHLAFQKALADTDNGIDLTRRWQPYLRAALSAARTTGDRRAVVGELFRAPGRKDPQELIQGAMVLGTAAYGVRNHDAMVAQMDAVAPGREASHDPSVAPGWNNGGGYMRRTALRRRG